MNGISNLLKPKSNYLISLLVNSKIPKSIKEIVYGLTLVSIGCCILFTRSLGIYLFGMRLVKSWLEYP